MKQAAATTMVRISAARTSDRPEVCISKSTEYGFYWIAFLERMDSDEEPRKDLLADEKKIADMWNAWTEELMAQNEDGSTMQRGR